MIGAASAISTHGQRGSTLTLDKLLALKRRLEAVAPVRQLPSRVVFSSDAVVPDGRFFPHSWNRSARIRKKLIKRFGGEFRMKPAIFQMGDQLLVHPAFRSEFERVALEPPADLSPLNRPMFAPYRGIRIDGMV